MTRPHRRAHEPALTCPPHARGIWSIGGGALLCWVRWVSTPLEVMCLLSTLSGCLSVRRCLLLSRPGGGTDKPTAAGDYTMPVARVLHAKHMRKAETSILGGLWEASQVPQGELDWKEEQGSLAEQKGRTGVGGGYALPTHSGGWDRRCRRPDIMPRGSPIVLPHLWPECACARTCASLAPAH